MASPFCIQSRYSTQDWYRTPADRSLAEQIQDEFCNLSKGPEGNASCAMKRDILVPSSERRGGCASKNIAKLPLKAPTGWSVQNAHPSAFFETGRLPMWQQRDVLRFKDYCS